MAWPAWLLGQNPARRIISASYSQALATKHSLDTRLIINSPWYQKIFPKTQIVSDHNQKDKFITTKRGFRLATSVGGTLTGEGGNFLILDDPHNPAHMNSITMRTQTLNWYDQVFASRLDDKKKGVMVLIMQRLHTDDLTGYLLAKNHKSWEYLSIPAIAKTKLYFPSPFRKNDDQKFYKNAVLHAEKEDIKALKNIESDIGSFTFSAKYLQNPLPIENDLIKQSWLKFYNAHPEEFLSITQSWDTAIKGGTHNDYSACTTWGETQNTYYLLDVFREKMEFPTLKRKIIQHAEKWKPHNILIEDKASGGSIIQDIRAETKLPIISINPKLDKIARLLSVSSMLESGKILFPLKLDSFTQFLIWSRTKKIIEPRIRML